MKVCLLVGLVFVGRAHAQIPQVFDCQKPVDIFERTWMGMTPEAQAEVCASRRVTTVDTFYRVDRGMKNPKLGVAGLLVAAAGIGVAFHPSERTTRVLNREYCVGNYRVDAGSCGSPAETRIGMAMIGAGVAMTWFGFRSTTVMIGPYRDGGTVTIRWELP